MFYVSIISDPALGLGNTLTQSEDVDPIFGGLISHCTRGGTQYHADVGGFGVVTEPKVVISSHADYRLSLTQSGGYR